ncbi:hypothetical protein NDA17_000360 [Ustilago hordei]|nr:hypothetical protein NDA17_000360 [Ustilago hordei]
MDMPSPQPYQQHYTIHSFAASLWIGSSIRAVFNCFTAQHNNFFASPNLYPANSNLCNLQTSSQYSWQQEKGLKTNKDVICGQIWQELFPDESTVGGAGQVKTKIHWLTEQYNNIKKTISQQTSAGVLLQDMDHNSSDYATCKSIAQSHPWFEHWHEMMTNCAQTGPVVLLTGHPYDATPASSQNNLVDADVNMDDASNAHYPQRCNIPGMESILEELQNDPIGARVISSFSSSVAATPAAASSSSHSPFSSSSNLSLIGPTPFTITPIDTPTHQHSSSTAFEADEVDNGDGDSVYHSPATGTTPKKSRPFTSKSKREELSEIVQACTQDMLQARIKVEEECTKREEMHIQFAREESERQECM